MVHRSQTENSTQGQKLSHGQVSTFDPAIPPRHSFALASTLFQRDHCQRVSLWSRKTMGKKSWPTMEVDDQRRDIAESQREDEEEEEEDDQMEEDVSMKEEEEAWLISDD